MAKERSLSSAQRRRAAEGRQAAGRGTHPVGGAIGMLIFGALGVVTFLFGKRAIDTEFFEYPSRPGSSLTLGPLGYDHPEGFRILEGPDAIFWGLAFCALGVMFALWGVGFVIAVFTPKRHPPEPSALGRVNTWLSFVALLLAILCLWPPWRLGSAIFYAVSVLLVGSIVYSVRENRPKVPQKVFPGVIIAAVLAGNISLMFVSVAIVLAMVAMFFVGIHVLILAPHLMNLKARARELK